jgi:hypothetical protein
VQLPRTLGIEPGRQIALGQAVPEFVVSLSLGWLSPVCTEQEKIAPVDQGEDQTADDTDDRDERRQCRSTAEPPD